MAVGDGGFSTRAMGFDKNEVNEYISSLRKKMNELEAAMKDNDRKTAEAKKLAESADERVKAAEAAGEEKAAEVTKQLTIEQHNSEKLKKQVETLKAQLEEEKQKMTDMLKSGKGVNAEAQRAYAEVLEKANDDAKEIVGSAQETAKGIIEQAQARSSETEEKLSAFMTMFRNQLETMNSGYKAINDSAAELLGAENAPEFSVEAPKYEPKTAPVRDDLPAKPVKTEEPAPAPKTEKAAAHAAKAEAPKPAEAPKKAEKPAPAAENKAAAKPAPAPAPAPKAEAPKPAPAPAEKPKEEETLDLDAAFDDWGGKDLADSIFADEHKPDENVPLVNPDAGDNIFGDIFGGDTSTDSDSDNMFGDLFNTDDSSGSDSDMVSDISEGLSGSMDDTTIDEIPPLDTSDHSKAEFDSDFASDLIAQTMTSSNLGTDADDELLAAVKEAEEKFAVQPTVPADELDMSENPAAKSAPEEELSDEDELMKALREAEEALSSLGGDTTEESAEEDTPAPVNMSADNPWEDLQKQLEAMEQDGSFSADENAFADSLQQDPAAPSADDASIWNFGSGDDNGSTDDDMMSSDFGGFGGF